MDIPEKLEELRKEDGLDELSVATIDSWTNQLEEIRSSESFLEHPETDKAREIAVLAIENIENRLRFDEDLPEMERKALFWEKRAHQVWLAFFTRDIEGATQALEDEIQQAEDLRG